MPTDRRTFLVKWNGRALAPVNASEHEAMDVRLRPGEAMTIQIYKQRSNDQLAYYWAKLKELLDSGAVSCCHDTETLHDILKLEMGFVKPVINMRGKLEFHPKSIAMDKLSQEEMNHFIDHAWALIAEHYGVDMEAIGDAENLSPKTKKAHTA